MSWEVKNLTADDHNKDGTLRTGMATIRTQPSNKKYREGWENIFGKKKTQKHPTKVKKLVVSCEDNR